jgi:sn-glycerol 3-phosphate transport system substrate-binding protein
MSDPTASAAPRRGRAAGPLAVAVCLALLAGACSATPARPASATRPDCVTDPARPADASLVVWHSFESIFLSAFEPLVADFEAETGRSVELVQFSSTDAILDAYRAAPAQDRPDLLTGSELTVTAMGQSGQFVPAATCAQATGSALGEQLVPAIGATWSVDGQWWAVPFAVSVPLLLARPSALESLNAEMPTTPEGLGDLAAELVAGGYRTGLAFDESLPGVVVEQWTARVGSPLSELIAARTMARLESPEAIAALTWFDGLVARGLAQPVRGGQPAAYREFIADENPFPMVVASSAALGAARLLASFGIPADGPPLASGLPLPGRGVLPGGSAWWLPARPGGDPLASYRFAAWMADPARQATFSIQTGYVPVHRGADGEPALVAAWGDFPALAVGWELLSTPVSAAVNDGVHLGPRAELRRLVVSAFERARAGQQTDASLARANRELQTLLDLYAQTVTNRVGG